MSLWLVTAVAIVTAILLPTLWWWLNKFNAVRHSDPHAVGEELEAMLRIGAHGIELAVTLEDGPVRIVFAKQRRTGSTVSLILHADLKTKHRQRVSDFEQRCRAQPYPLRNRFTRALDSGVIEYKLESELSGSLHTLRRGGTWFATELPVVAGVEGEPLYTMKMDGAFTSQPDFLETE